MLLTGAGAAAAALNDTHAGKQLNTGLHQCIRLCVAFLFYFALTYIHFRFHFSINFCVIYYDQSVIVFFSPSLLSSLNWLFNLILGLLLFFFLHLSCSVQLLYILIIIIVFFFSFCILHSMRPVWGSTF